MNKASLLILVFLILWIFKNWIFSPVISAGDYWFYFNSMYSNHFIHPYSWYNTVISNGLGGQGFAYVNVNIVVATVLEFAKLFNLSWEIVSKVLFYFMYLILSSISSIFLIKKIFPDNKFWILSPLIFVFNTYILMVVGGGQIITAISYSIIPFSVYLSILILDKPKNFLSDIQKIISLAFIFSLQCILDLRIAFITFIAIAVYFLISLFKEFNLKKIVSLFFAFLIVGLMCSYWILPMFIYGIDPIAQLGVDYRSTDIVKFLSFAKLENSMGLLHPYWPENIFGKIGFMKPEFLLLPVIAFSSLLFIKRKNKLNKYIVYFSIISLIGIFLGKGANEPLGNLYLFLFDNIPGFQLFRDSFKWYSLIALGYSLLIPFAVQEIYYSIKNKNITFNKYKFINIQNFFVLIIFLVIFILLKPALFGELQGTFKSRNIPYSYIQLNEYLSSDKSFFRTLWVPQTMQFGHYTNSHTSIAGRDFFREYSHDKLLAKLSSESARKTLDETGVKYVIIPEDTESEIYLSERKYDEKKYKYIVDNVDKISWLTKDKTFGKIKVYKTEKYKDHFWCNCSAIIKYEFINPTKYKISFRNAKTNDRLVFSEAFDNKWIVRDGDHIIRSQKYGDKYNSFSLSKGDGEFELFYEPQKLVDVGTSISLITIFTSGLALIIITLQRRRK